MADQQSTPEPPKPGAPPKPEPMTRERAIELLKTDVKAWNKWREENRDEKLPDLSKADLPGAYLKEADLFGVHLEGANLDGAHLEGANLIDAHLEGAKLHIAHLEGAHLFWAHLEGAELFGVHLEGAELFGVHLEGAKLPGAHLEGADLRGADFSNANVTGVRYDRKPGKFRGIRVATCFGHALFVRDARDQDYIETRIESLRADWGSWKERKEQQRKELDVERSESKGRCSWSWRRKSITAWIGTSREWLHLVTRSALMRIWSWIDYGRSLGRVGGAAFLVAMIFGAVFHACDGMLYHESEKIDYTWFTPYYYSIVTYTTLGFGDVTPKTSTGQMLVTAEVILGYVTLGLLVSILANKVARRA